uniref:Ig-like domain-containing protein n=1 Tax=Erpetoichthys calabaricus TaxID=27687 RepID=A0A8C4XAX8_ERPCA
VIMIMLAPYNSDVSFVKADHLYLKNYEIAYSLSASAFHECGLMFVKMYFIISIIFFFSVAPKVSVKPPFVVVNQPNVLECHAEDYYPNIISIKWRRNSTYLPGQQDVKGLANENGTFAAVNLHNYTPSEEDIGVNFSCEVKHEALDGQLVEVSQEICSKCPLRPYLVRMKLNNWNDPRIIWYEL